MDELPAFILIAKSHKMELHDVKGNVYEDFDYESLCVTTNDYGVHSATVLTKDGNQYPLKALIFK